MDKSPGHAPDVSVSNSKAGTTQTSVSFRNKHFEILQLIVSFSHSLNVSQNIRNKIINGQYIDLA